MKRGLHWLPVTRVKRTLIPEPLRVCLLDTGSLTNRLARYCKGNFGLRLQGQSWQRPLPDENQALNLRRGSNALVREIYLQCNDVPWVYGRSIIPEHTCTGSERRLAFWGQRSLGNYLFSGHNIRRGEIEIARIRPQDKLFQLACRDATADRSRLWGRRSIFYIKDKPLLVVEIFLTDLIRCMNT
ncbi:MAG: chorismate--pyruvate lyase family protein [Gammaproteobacteria bacterium]